MGSIYVDILLVNIDIIYYVSYTNNNEKKKQFNRVHTYMHTHIMKELHTHTQQQYTLQHIWFLLGQG